MITKEQLTCCSLRGRGGAGVLRVGVQVGVDVVGHLEAVSLRVSLHHHLPELPRGARAQVLQRSPVPDSSIAAFFRDVRFHVWP